jgi:hypothetical protein
MNERERGDRRLEGDERKRERTSPILPTSSERRISNSEGWWDAFWVEVEAMFGRRLGGWDVGEKLAREWCVQAGGRCKM